MACQKLYRPTDSSQNCLYGHYWRPTFVYWTNYKCNNEKYFTGVQLRKFKYASVGHRYLKVGVWIRKPVYLVWTPFASCSATHLRIKLIRRLIVACGMFSRFNGCAKLLDIGRTWNTLSYTSIQSIPNMLNGWHAWVCRSLKQCR
jgi:hypothetical protein